MPERKGDPYIWVDCSLMQSMGGMKMSNKEVALQEATHMVFTDYGPDPCIVGFANSKDAQEYMDCLNTADGYSGTFDHYMVAVVNRITITHERCCNG